MATLTSQPRIALRVAFEVDEAEARALDALVGYGADAFINAFYEKLGKAYLQEHEAGLRKFFKSIRDMMPGILKRMQDGTRVFTHGEAYENVGFIAKLESLGLTHEQATHAAKHGFADLALATPVADSKEPPT